MVRWIIQEKKQYIMVRSGSVATKYYVPSTITTRE